MGACGRAVVDFGAFPGKSDAATLVVTPGYTATSLSECWILGEDSADHTANEHEVETISVFTAYFTDGFLAIGLVNDNAIVNREGPSPMIWGQWNVGWVWQDP